MKKILRNIVDKLGVSIFSHRQLPIGTDYRKTLRRMFPPEEIEVVFDVGANMGQFCIHCNEIFKNSQIYSFEPVNRTYEILTERTKRIKNISCFNFAFGEKEGSAEIFLQELTWMNSLNKNLNVPTGKDQKTQKVQINTIDSFAKSKNINSIDFLKIDTEGFDLDVLKGAVGLLEERKIKFIFVEVSFNERNNQNSSFDSINSFLRKYNFEIHGFYNQSIHDKSHYMDYCDALFFLQPNS
ncbi:MAG: FkbM family methyltransferase [Melioribacteraceae bacterium]|nr:FkbM family methyltransferase [Melioribacteraceae bacterium]MCF8263141.1 FkbM family methyltransferase [Melioribacteraceae bacterium]MCF8413698.1 FkbM family methyltransferase [Melioribacteraceae bacterium]MCF8430371.1 FkbM family methyltransferase [Melioribacteraceae bacterium]